MLLISSHLTALLRVSSVPFDQLVGAVGEADPCARHAPRRRGGEHRVVVAPVHVVRPGIGRSPRLRILVQCLAGPQLALQGRVQEAAAARKVAAVVPLHVTKVVRVLRAPLPLVELPHPLEALSLAGPQRALRPGVAGEDTCYEACLHVEEREGHHGVGHAHQGDGGRRGAEELEVERVHAPPRGRELQCARHLRFEKGQPVVVPGAHDHHIRPLRGLVRPATSRRVRGDGGRGGFALDRLKVRAPLPVEGAEARAAPHSAGLGGGAGEPLQAGRTRLVTHHHALGHCGHLARDVRARGARAHDEHGLARVGLGAGVVLGVFHAAPALLKVSQARQRWRLRCLVVPVGDDHGVKGGLLLGARGVIRPAHAPRWRAGRARLVSSGPRLDGQDLATQAHSGAEAKLVCKRV
mmetsp:Transcript_17316/g.53744  ORF Transcript_17316/g.53744 Transcript_17316/m.53744 type:complete len:409 (+) Transcript_17316:98-1324(+)